MFSFFLGFVFCYFVVAFYMAFCVIRSTKRAGFPIQRDEFYPLVIGSLAWPVGWFNDGYNL